jgi:hypothetical protein
MNIANSQLGSRRTPWQDTLAAVRRGKKVAEIKRLSPAIRSATLIAHRRSSWASRPACFASQGNGQDDFDATAWMAVVEEQKLAIARAAGVDPSKVRIRIGH